MTSIEGWVFVSNAHAEASCVLGSTACIVGVAPDGELVTTTPPNGAQMPAIPRAVVEELYRRHDERRRAHDACPCETCRRGREKEARARGARTK